MIPQTLNKKEKSTYFLLIWQILFREEKNNGTASLMGIVSLGDNFLLICRPPFGIEYWAKIRKNLISPYIDYILTIIFLHVYKFVRNG